MEAVTPFCSTPRLTALAEKLKRVAKSDSTLLLSGETGTGKKVWANFVHQHSKRAGKHFHSVNITSLTKELIESELFGVPRGIYTGQASSREGHIMAANGGTLFLDEIGDLSWEAQTKILHVFDEHAITPVGSTIPRPVNIRFIFATKHDLRRLIDEGKFRDDLYYRILVEHVELPSLRDYSEEIPMLANFFLDHWAKRTHKRLHFSPAAMSKLLTHSWPGNIRELEHTIERSLLVCQSSELRPEDFEFRRNGAHIVPLAEHLDGLRIEYVRQIVSRCGGDRQAAAKCLHVGVNAVHKAMEA